MTGYIRQDIANEIDNGQVIKAPPLDAEFNALVAAFSAASGHRHNGVTGEGAPITVVGPLQDAVISTNSITPKTDNTLDLGSSLLEFKDIWIDGTANIDLLAADAGTVAGAPITTNSNTQTLTNKTIDLTNNTLVATSAQIAAAVTDETGTGSLVLATSPALAGVPTAPTAVAGTNTTQLATTAHVFAERSNPATLTNKTLDLLNNTLVATSAQVAAAVTDETGTGALVFASSPALAGVPTAPTAAPDTNTSQIATTAHVFAERSNTATLSNKTLTSPTLNTPSINNPTITGGAITGITDLAVADGGTGASDPAGARTNLGAQEVDAGLTSIAGLLTSADQTIYTTAADTYATTSLTGFGRSLIDDADAAGGRATLGLGTIATQNAATVSITGGTITGITDLAVADGGTGASTPAEARTNLGLVIGTDVQAQDAELQAIAGLVSAADQVPYFTGVGTAALTSFTSFGRSLVDDANAAAARTTVGVEYASQAEAEAAVVSTKVVSPLTTKQQIDARLATQIEAETATDNVKLMTPLRTAQAIPLVMAAASLGSVGSYAFLVRNGNAAPLAAGSTVAGSGLVYGAVIASNAFNFNTAVDGTSGTVPSGTWRLMGHFAHNTEATKVSLWLRIS